MLDRIVKWKSWIVPVIAGTISAAVLLFVFFHIEEVEEKSELGINLIDMGFQFGTTYLAILATIFTILTTFAESYPKLRENPAFSPFKDNTKVTIILCAIQIITALLGKMLSAIEILMIRFVFALIQTFFIPCIIIISIRQFISLFSIDKNIKIPEKD